jgi:hypothetical protein
MSLVDPLEELRLKELEALDNLSDAELETLIEKNSKYEIASTILSMNDEEIKLLTL